MRRILQISLPVIFLCGGIFGAHWLLTHRNKILPEPKQQFRPVVEVVSASSVTYTPQIFSQGVAASRRTIKFHPEISGKISSLSPDLVPGAVINEGEKQSNLFII